MQPEIVRLARRRQALETAIRGLQTYQNAGSPAARRACLAAQPAPQPELVILVRRKLALEAAIRGLQNYLELDNPNKPSRSDPGGCFTGAAPVAC